MWLAGFDNRMRYWPSWYLPQNGFKGSTLPLCILEALPSRKGQVLLIPSFLPWDSLTLSEVTMSPVTTISHSQRTGDFQEFCTHAERIRDRTGCLRGEMEQAQGCLIIALG